MNDLPRGFEEPAGALPPPYDEADLDRVFGLALDRGRTYQSDRRVQDLSTEADGRELAASVRGSRSRPYKVSVSIATGGPVRFAGHCSCPVGWNCKHVAAVLLEALYRLPLHPLPPPRPRLPVDPRQALAPRAATLSPAVVAWVDRLRGVEKTAQTGAEQILYRFDGQRQPGGPFVLELRVVRILKTGAYGADRACPPGNLESGTARYVMPDDRLIARLLGSGLQASPVRLPDDAASVGLLLERLIATGRCRWRELNDAPLRLGPLRSGRLGWRLGPDGRQVAEIAIDGGLAIPLPCAAPWYVDPDTHLAGPLDLGVPLAVASLMLASPALAVAEATVLNELIERDFASLNLPRPRADIVEEILTESPVPVLRLANRQRKAPLWGALPRDWDPQVEVALFGFAYGGTLMARNAVGDERRVVDGNVVVRRRDRASERAAHARLAGVGLTPMAAAVQGSDPAFSVFGFTDEAEWPRFFQNDLPLLRASGWQIDVEEGFRGQVLDAGGDWEAAVEDKGGWWFSLDLGVEVDGERIALLPVLTSLLNRLRDASAADGIDALARDGKVFGRLADGRYIALPLDRTKSILSTLVELFQPGAVSPDGTLEISAGEAVGLAAVEDATRLRWLGGERLRALIDRLCRFTALERVEPPDGLKTTLRAYQRDGLDWLQFLRAYELGGILADDMGLGKTVQTLAHILVEKNAGRLDRPVLVVCPTSVIPNWRAEAERLTPILRVLSLHGVDRAQRFSEIDRADLVLTTYPLLARDAEQLLAREWHIVVLDEAQAIKNAAAKTTQLACRLDARHRLCLTGTPIENHLGELWSQFAFLMPGLLGDSKRFARVFRTPIEKKRDDTRRGVLAARIKPLLLRRTKAVVATELPPKSEILLPLELDGAQRDLYETVRLAMHDKVRQAIAEKGLARSHIVVLDALLKLRQVCCDPRLVKLTAARRVSSSVKLDHLMEMLPELVEDGRRILLFSQFTSMLDLIKKALAETAIRYVELRGETKDRAGPVARFQKGEVPLFLISLKAGGTGLNLTAADTVIHYDPWWNPAVEDQATDRAYRIGQDKPVFVYKLVTQGTVEERMIELQRRKKDLADGLLGATGGTGVQLEASDLERLFEPVD